MSHAVVWLDHHEARIYPLSSPTLAKQIITTPYHPQRHHPATLVSDKAEPGDVKKFFHSIATALAGYLHILVVGPSTAKSAFHNYAVEHDKSLATRISAVQTVDHPTDGQIAALGREYYRLDTELQT
ncbi:MAG TPA: hypothetical protein VGC41_11515 [Kofleriaceae bacterium]